LEGGGEGGDDEKTEDVADVFETAPNIPKDDDDDDVDPVSIICLFVNDFGEIEFSQTSLKIFVLFEEEQQEDENGLSSVFLRFDVFLPTFGDGESSLFFIDTYEERISLSLSLLLSHK